MNRSDLIPPFLIRYENEMEDWMRRGGVEEEAQTEQAKEAQFIADLHRLPKQSPWPRIIAWSLILEL